MIVRLTEAQLAATRLAFEHAGKDWVSQDWLAVVTLEPGHQNTFSVAMPAIGWLQALSFLMDETIGPRGGNRRGTKQSALNARQRIARALSQYTAHPAFFDIGLPGRRYDLIPAWTIQRAKRGGRVYDAFPTPGGEFVTLCPQYRAGFTIWRAERTTTLDDRWVSTLNEVQHLRFSDRGAQQAAEA